MLNTLREITQGEGLVQYFESIKENHCVPEDIDLRIQELKQFWSVS
jgi:hypothetical protein